METKSVYVQKLPVDIFRKVKSLAALRGIKMQELWLELIERGLASLEKDKT